MLDAWSFALAFLWQSGELLADEEAALVVQSVDSFASANPPVFRFLQSRYQPVQRHPDS